ncbi:MAG: carbohydate-binding domain-containing protein [Colwellia sp.]
MRTTLNKIIMLSITVLCQGSALANVQLTQKDLDHVGDKLIVNYEIMSNVNVKGCQQDVGEKQCYLGEISLTFPASLPNNDWQIYFGITSPIGWDGSNDFDINRVNGDLHTLSPVGQNIIAGKTYVIPFKGVGQYVAESEALPNYFIAATNKNLSAKVIQSTVPKIDAESQLTYYPHVKPFISDDQRKHSAEDKSPLATPEYLYQHHAAINAFSDQITVDKNRIIPQVKQAALTTKQLNLDKGLLVSAADFNNRELNVAFKRLTNKGLNISNKDNKQAAALKLIISKQEALGTQGYQIKVTDQTVQINASSTTGLFYGLMTIEQLLTDNLTLPQGELNDVPRYDFRGVHLDVARNFHSKDFVLKLLDQMAALKINKFHFHLAEDEAWRLEIPGLPELTDVGAYRCYDPSEQNCLLPQLGNGPTKDTPVNGYLSTDDYIDIVKYADARHIEVIPSLDMPGHSRAAVKSMDARYKKFIAANEPKKAAEYMLTELADESSYSSIQHYNDNTLNPCIDSTYRFVDKILTEIISLHESAGAPLKRYHIGADETAGAWLDSPACKQLMQQNKNIHKTEELTAYFVEQVAQMVSGKGIIAGAWGDGLNHANKDNLPAMMQANVWGLLPAQSHNRAHGFANLGWDTILSLPDALYLDFPYQADPKERGNDWGTRNIDSFKLFQFMPDNLPVHAEIWQNSRGHAYSSTEDISLDKGRKFTGIQAQLWSETTLSDNAAGYMFFPRLIAFAERAWHKASWTVPYQAGQAYSPTSGHLNNKKIKNQLQDWAQFSQVLVSKILPQLAKDELFFRLPTPGAKIVNDVLYANSMFTDLVIEYRLVNGQEKSQWQAYNKPVSLPKSTEVELRNRLTGMTRTGRIISIK